MPAFFALDNDSLRESAGEATPVFVTRASQQRRFEQRERFDSNDRRGMDPKRHPGDQ
jgi:hypothetical protein